MSHLWFVNTESGWSVKSYSGRILSHQGFVCDCKGIAFLLKKKWKYISDRSTNAELVEYYNATGIEYERTVRFRQFGTEEGNYP